MRYPRGRRLAGRRPASRAVARRHGEGRWVCGASGLSWTCPRQRSRQTRGFAACCARQWFWLPPTRLARAAAHGGAASGRCGWAGAATAPRHAHCRRARRSHRPTGGGPALPRPGAGRLRHGVTAPVQRGTGGRRPRSALWRWPACSRRCIWCRSASPHPGQPEQSAVVGLTGA